MEDKFQRNHDWKKMTNRAILDSICQECDLVWTITEPDTIRISKKPE